MVKKIILKILPSIEISVNEISSVTPLLICSDNLKNEAEVPLCSGKFTSIITAFLLATGPAPSIEAIKAKMKKII